ncbi:MAG: WbqC family protein [Bacteroidales bacterium]|nr:WbqC family protein [Bacteroidales bacterium]
MNRSLLILPTAYYPPVQYFAEILKSGKVLIEQHETYPKQTYRNRCYIYSANGVLPLSIPVERGSFHKVKLLDIRIDYSRKWQKEHMHAIRSAYNSSAFFEFYADEVLKPLVSQHKFLIDLNMHILEIIFEALEIDITALKTDNFIKDYGADCLDLRYKPVSSDGPDSGVVSYFQVFSPKHGFKPDLSIIDLLFNMGPESWSYLRTLTGQG